MKFLFFLTILLGILLMDRIRAVNSQYQPQYGYQGGSSYNDPYSKGYPGTGSNSGYPGYSGYPGSNTGGIGQYNSGYSGSYSSSPIGQSNYQGGSYGGYNQNPANNESPYGDFGIRHPIDDNYQNWYPNNDDGIPYAGGSIYPYFTYDRTKN